jgi:hypothetical protein
MNEEMKKVFEKIAEMRGWSIKDVEEEMANEMCRNLHREMKEKEMRELKALIREEKSSNK